MKKLQTLLAIGLCSLFVVSCSDKSSTPDTNKASEVAVNSQEDLQQQSIASIKQVDDDGYLYEMDYLADYKLDQLLAEDTWPGYHDKLQQLIPSSFFTSASDTAKPGCSAFSTTDATGNPIMGRNYDWDKDNRIHVALHTHPTNGYAAVGMSDVGFLHLNKDNVTDSKSKEGLLYAPFFTVDGVNEKGFACTVLLLEENGVKQETGKTKLVASVVVRLLLDKAASVDEAINLLQKYDVVSPFYKDVDENNPHGGNGLHWMIADAQGNRAVLEYVNGELKINKMPDTVQYDVTNGQFALSYPKEEKPYQIVTNFYVTEGATNEVGEGYWRYKVIKDSLEANAHPSKAQAMDILKSVRFFKNDMDTHFSLIKQNKDPENNDNWGWITVWSEVFDLNAKAMDVCIRENYDKLYTFNVK